MPHAQLLLTHVVLLSLSIAAVVRAADVSLLVYACVWLLQSVEYAFWTRRPGRVAHNAAMADVAAVGHATSLMIMHGGIRPLIAVHAIQVC